MDARIRSSVLAVGLGCAQLIAWGVLYYSITVLAEPMQIELGLAPSEVFGSFTAALVISGMLAPWAGRLLDRAGGRAVLSASALVGAASFAMLARADSLLGLIAGWTVAGVAMAMGLYDACFAAIGQIERQRYRTVVTSVTLFAGFASTVSWPLSAYLVTPLGWRGLCDAYAVGLLLCAAIYLAVLPAHSLATARRSHSGPEVKLAVTAATRTRARILAYAFAGAALIGGSMSAHVVGVLSALDLPSDHVIWIASSIGALQVFGRVVDLAFGARRSGTQLGFFTFAALAASMGLLVVTESVPWVVYGFALLYGVANGLITIAKATIPIELFGFENVGTLLGTFGAPSLVTRAFAPLLFAAAMGAGGVSTALLAVTSVGFVSLGAFLFAVRTAPKTASPA